MSTTTTVLSKTGDETEEQRAERLLYAQSKANEMFGEIASTLLRPGVTEKQISDEINALGQAKYGVRTHWHRRVIRSGPNTLFPYGEDPPDRTLEADDICFVDLGPVFEAWEADFGRTFVLGDDPIKNKIRDDLEPTWHKVKARWQEKKETITGGELYDICVEEANKAGWEFGGKIGGHLVGDFPHERIPRDKISLYIIKDNDTKMNTLDKNGNKRHWILEMHLVDRERQIGGFFEQLLTV